jgi:putative transcriptional regulator
LAPKKSSPRVKPKKGTAEVPALEDSTSDLLRSAHNTMAGLHRIGLVDKKTMQDFDELCFPKIIEMTASDIKALRQSLNLSQPVFALYLNTSKSTVSKWEQGDKKPNGIAQCLLNVIANKGLEVLI